MKNIIHFISGAITFISLICMVFALVWISYFDRYLEDFYWGLMWLFLLPSVFAWVITGILIKIKT